MSFSREVKEELFNVLPKSRHCMIAELLGIFMVSSADLHLDEPKTALDRKVFTLLNKTLNIGKDVTAEERKLEIKRLLRLEDGVHTANELLIQQTCCRRSFIRGIFLGAGSISDPNKGYHFEIVLKFQEQAVQLSKLVNTFEIDAKYVSRGGRFVVYLKEGAQIVEILRVMEASLSVMELENIRIVKEVRGTVNRKVNCETANIGKTVSTAYRQIEDINLIEAKMGLSALSVQLKDMAEVRLMYPDAPLKDLGQYLDPPIGKSGVNHRLKRLSSIAGDLRRM